MQSLQAAVARPSIVLAESEADRLTTLAQQVLSSEAATGAALLLEEIERACVVPDQELPPHVVRMHAVVEFVDEGRDQRRTVVLVYPREADIAAGKVSITSPVGAGLIGLSVGQQILWPDRDGRERPLRILKVRAPERLAF
jgi:regulator of nucleoside diphosphate kinase